MSGSTQFTPRVSPRPKYEPATEVLKAFLWAKLQSPTIATILCYALEYPHRRLQTFFRGFGDFNIPINRNADLNILVPNDDRLWYCLVSCAIHITLYWVINSIFLYIDINGYLQEYKLDRKGPKHAKIDWKLLQKNWTEALFGQLIMGPIGFYFIIYPVAKYFGMPTSDAALEPNVFKLYLAFVGCTCFNEWFFYWSHRTLHHKAIYKYIHK